MNSCFVGATLPEGELNLSGLFGENGFIHPRLRVVASAGRGLVAAGKLRKDEVLLQAALALSSSAAVKWLNTLHSGAPFVPPKLPHDFGYLHVIVTGY